MMVLEERSTRTKHGCMILILGCKNRANFKVDYYILWSGNDFILRTEYLDRTFHPYDIQYPDRWKR